MELNSGFVSDTKRPNVSKGFLQSEVLGEVCVLQGVIWGMFSAKFGAKFLSLFCWDIRRKNFSKSFSPKFPWLCTAKLAKIQGKTLMTRFCRGTPNKPSGRLVTWFRAIASTHLPTKTQHPWKIPNKNIQIETCSCGISPSPGDFDKSLLKITQKFRAKNSCKWFPQLNSANQESPREFQKNCVVLPQVWLSKQRNLNEICQRLTNG